VTSTKKFFTETIICQPFNTITTLLADKQIRVMTSNKQKGLQLLDNQLHERIIPLLKRI